MSGGRRGGGGGGGGGSLGWRGQGNYTNPCLTMHQPWASLLVCGIKRIEGRSWPAPIRGRLWIHAASKVPEEATIRAMEDFYREIYAVNGITDVKFPEHYPVSRLLGCVEVVGCLKLEELVSWDAVPEGVRLEGQTDFCWLCEQPKKLLIPFEMRGYQGVYNLEKKIYESAVRGLLPVKAPMPVTFPLPDPGDPFSLKPGSISILLDGTKAAGVETSSSLAVAIAGARAAATQFDKKNQALPTYSVQTNELLEEDETNDKLHYASNEESSISNETRIGNHIKHDESNSFIETREDLKQLPGAHAKIFAGAVRGLKPS